MMKARSFLIILLITGTQVACSRPNDAALDLAISDQLPANVKLTSVPFHPQTARDDCGPAALAMMLNWTGEPIQPLELASKVYTPGREGTLQSDIIQASRRHGRLGTEVRNLNDLLLELAAGNPVLVLQNLGLGRWPQWHYAVAIGYDLGQQTLLLRSGNQATLPLAFSAFEQSWVDSEFWGLTITRPGDLPATADATALLQAASGLEQSNRGDEAALAYGAMLQRWPDNLPALMGWGNARYARGDFRVASEAFRHAVTLHPNATEAWNNLAYSLLEQDRFNEAEHAARKAVQHGGPHREAAEATLAEILAKRG